MNCYRCRSVMLPSAPLRFHAMLSTDLSEQLHSPSYRCPCCGTYEDLTIRRNRLRSQEVPR